MENFGGGDFCRGGVEQGINSVVLGKVKFEISIRNQSRHVRLATDSGAHGRSSLEIHI